MSIEDLSAVIEITARQGVPLHVHIHFGSDKFRTNKDNLSGNSKAAAPATAQAIGLDAEILQVLRAGPQKKEAIIRLTEQGKGPSHGRAVSRALERLAAEGRVTNIRHGWWSLPA